MKIKDIFNKALLGLAGIAGLCSGCEYLEPEGIRIKAEADGVISEEEESELVSIIDNKEKIDELNKPIQNFVNDYEEFIINDFSRQGIHHGSFDDNLHHFMVKDYDELKAKYERGGFAKKPGDMSAYHSSPNNTVYMVKGDYLFQFLTIFEHEVGHSKRLQSREFMSMANEDYAAFKLYALNKKIGAHYLENSLIFFPDRKIDLALGDREYYTIGAMAFILEANRYDGNLEKAMERIQTTPTLHLEKEVYAMAARYESMREAYFAEGNEMIFSRGSGKALPRSAMRNSPSCRNISRQGYTTGKR